MKEIFRIAMALFFIHGFSSNTQAMKIYFKDPQYSFQLLRTIGYTATGGADIGECLKTAYKIKEGDDESWYKEWHAVAQQLEQTADNFLDVGHKQSAMEAYFRASNYYRTAEFFLHSNPNDERINKTWLKSVHCFQKAANFLDHKITDIRIPFEETTLPGYLCMSKRSSSNSPLLIIQTGFDGSKEELYFAFAKAALDRGYNCLLFEGPGQGEVIRLQKLPFRPNWETVVKPVVDYAEKLSFVDKKNIILIGFSFGGYLAPRAAASEKRLKACIANGGVYNFYETFAKHFPKNLDLLLANKKDTEELNKDIYKRMKDDPDVRWAFANGMWTFDASTPCDLIQKLKPYNLIKQAPAIKCKMLVIDSTGDMDMPGQSKQLYDALKCDRSYMVFNEKEGAEEHCQMGAVMISNERTLNWLDDLLGRNQ